MMRGKRSDSRPKTFMLTSVASPAGEVDEVESGLVDADVVDQERGDVREHHRAC